MKKKLKVAVLYGGVSSERKISLQTGKMIAKNLDRNKYKVSLFDAKTDLYRLFKKCQRKDIDVVFIALHGLYGEDGTVQGMLELLDIPYTGSGVLASALGMNKLMSKKIYQKSGIPVPKYLVFQKKKWEKDKKSVYSNIKQKINFPCIVKPSTCGSSVGVGKALNKKELEMYLNQAFLYDNIVLVEEFISGREITGGVLGNDKLLALPIVELIPSVEFFTYKAKYTPGITQEIVPARVSEKLTKKAQKLAKACHKALGCSGMSRTDMIITRKALKNSETIRVLETNTIPGMTKNSLFPKAAADYGIGFPELLDRIINLAIDKYR
jgi:D-alanine-D-alanine ligase